MKVMTQARAALICEKVLEAQGLDPKRIDPILLAIILKLISLAINMYVDCFLTPKTAYRFLKRPGPIGRLILQKETRRLIREEKPEWVDTHSKLVYNALIASCKEIPQEEFDIIYQENKPE